MKGVFVTGTGTGVGKTVVAAAALSFFLKYGSAVPMKPVQTGAIRRRSQWRSPDLDFVLRTTGLQLNAREYQRVVPYLFQPACSPHLAARKAKKRISLPRILHFAQQLAERYENIVVEGAGGIMVPVNESQTMLDLAVHLKLPILIAAHAGLGTLNHTLLTVSVLQRASLPIAGICMWARHWGFIERDNLLTLQRRTHLPVVKFPFCHSACSGHLSSRDLSVASSSLKPILDSCRLRRIQNIHA